MGNYTAIATRVKVKKTAPAGFITFMDGLFGIGDETSTSTELTVATELNDAIEDLHFSLVCRSSYHEGYYQRSKVDCEDHWLYETLSSAKRPQIKVFVSLLQGSQEHFLLEEGDILYREVYEDFSTETIVYFSNNKFSDRKGWKYADDRGYMIDSEHPWSGGGADDVPPWNITELDKAMNKKSSHVAASYGY